MKQKDQKEQKDQHGRTETEFLSNYSLKKYPQPSVTADIIVFCETDQQVKILLIRRKNHPYLGKWALPGGFVRETESVQETAVRELEEETHLKGVQVEPVGLFSVPGRDPRGWVVSEAYVAKISHQPELQADDDAMDAAWFNLSFYDTLQALTLKFFSPIHGTFQAVLKKRLLPGILKERIEYTEEDNGELAFDHACMIACAIQKIYLF